MSDQSIHIKDGRDYLFRVVSPTQVYTIFANGEIEGFPTDSIVINHYPAFVAMEILQFREKK